MTLTQCSGTHLTNTSTATASDLFTFAGSNVRTVLKGSEPWFVASDVARILGYRMASDLTRNLDEDEEDTHNLRTLGGSQVFTIINESGLYTAILRSRRKEAKAFKKWLTSEVLPSLRKRGMYIQGQQNIRSELLDSLATTIRDKALPALREYDRITEHLHWKALKNPERHDREHRLAIDRIALDFDLPRSVVAALTQQGRSAVCADTGGGSLT